MDKLSPGASRGGWVHGVSLSKTLHALGYVDTQKSVVSDRFTRRSAEAGVGMDYTDRARQESSSSLHGRIQGESV